MFSLLMSVQVNPLLSLRQCFNMNFALFSSYLWKFLKIMYRPCKSQQDNGKHNTGSITTEESVAELACLQSRLSTSWKHLVYHDVKNTTKKTQGCWAARIWYWTRMRQDSSPKSPAVFSVARYLWHLFKRRVCPFFLVILRFTSHN